MKRTSGGLWAAAATVVLASGCNPPSTSLYIAGVLAPPTATAGTTCSYTANATGPFEPQPTVDVSMFAGSSPTYTAVFLVANQLESTASSSQLRVETSRIILDSAIVYVEDANGNTISSFTRAISGELDPSSGSTPSYNSVTVLVIDGTAGDFVGNQILSQHADETLVSKVKLHGTTLGGDSVYSSVFPQAIDFCLGCLVVPFPEPGGEASCTAGAVATSTPCFFGQDVPIECCDYPIAWCDGVTPTFPTGD